jgi:hypothetical protein
MFASAAQAARIAAVFAPNLVRPADGVLYGFDILVVGTYGLDSGRSQGRHRRIRSGL